eukprot:scaffold1131_cov161-Amphora_coffeaeformis.AAC.2
MSLFPGQFLHRLGITSLSPSRRLHNKSTKIPYPENINDFSDHIFFLAQPSTIVHFSKTNGSHVFVSFRCAEIEKMNYHDVELPSSSRGATGDANQQAMIAVHAILQAGGTQDAAEVAALAILTKHDAGRQAKDRAKQMAEMMVSLALLSVRTAVISPQNNTETSRPKQSRSEAILYRTKDDIDAASCDEDEDRNEHPRLRSLSVDSGRSTLYDVVTTCSRKDDALLFTTAKTREALRGLRATWSPTASPFSWADDDEESQCIVLKNHEEESFVGSLLTTAVDDTTGAKVLAEKNNGFSISKGNTTWQVTGFKEMEPRAGLPYFPFLLHRSTTHLTTCAIARAIDCYKPIGRIISVCVPCFNEEAASLNRSIRSLSEQRTPEGVRLEIVVVMDGIQQISQSMQDYLGELFGISTQPGASNNPFEFLSGAQTVIVECVKDSTDSDSSGATLSLVLKRSNKRKVNSQMWWLKGHARDSRCEFAFATDCGIVFDAWCMKKMLERMDRQPNLSALTGYQRVMTAKMQGDSRFEFLVDPIGFFLRLLQAYDFELSQSTTKSALDSIGFLPVLPGPCSLFRFKHLVGVTHEYLSLTTRRSKPGENMSRIILGNVQLAEDRFPPVLLTFRSKEDCVESGIENPRVGFEHDAVFYFEAEKPLGQLVKQRRRWINGAYIAVSWVLKESWIKNADHSFFTKATAFIMLLLEFLQGIAVRLFVPGTIACGIIFMCTIIPPIYFNDTETIKSTLDDFKDADPYLYWIGCCASGFYLFVFALFLVLHMPRAIETKHNGHVVLTNDKRSAYRPWLFFLAFLLNAVVVGMFIYVGVGVYRTLGWSESPGYLRALTALTTLPYLVAFVDGLVNSKNPSFRTIFNLIWMSPVYFVTSLWFYVWFPAYASARISDLSWGNREGGHEEETNNYTALARQYYGRVATVILILFNTAITVLAAGVVHAIPGFLTIVLFTLLAFNVILHAVNLFDMLLRLLGRIWILFMGTLPQPPQEDDLGFLKGFENYEEDSTEEGSD